jgi:hypothetical protein
MYRLRVRSAYRIPPYEASPHKERIYAVKHVKSTSHRLINYFTIDSEPLLSPLSTNPIYINILALNKIDVRKGLDRLGLLLLAEEVAALGLLGNSLEVRLRGGPLSHCLLVGLVRLLALDDLLLASGGLDVGQADVQLLAQDTAVDLF